MNELSLSYNNSPSDRLIAETVFNVINSSTRTPYFAKFHLIANGEHFLVLSKTERVSDRVFRVKNEIYSFEGANKTFSETPKSMDTFIHDISQFPLLKLDSKKNSTPVENKSPTYFDVKKMRVFLSRELLSGIYENRGSEHSVSPAVLQRCIEKKQNYIYRSRDNKFELYFFDTEKNRVLNLIAVFEPTDFERRHLNIMTAYYPTDSILRYRLNNCSDFYYETWKKGLPQV